MFFNHNEKSNSFLAASISCYCIIDLAGLVVIVSLTWQD